ncbi:axoneme-associated protein mst101(2)-like isoform X10 [Heptranchias perlo]|uniref:axoneme-associated protein mst101(2)-like isoform X10 n=1 Tax=Heptranchias perlo TaxID=212740 RepID=UPI00355A5889
MATRRQTLRSRASVSTPEQEAKLDEVPKSQLHTDALQCNPFIRNTSKKVEEFLLWFQTPSQPSRGSNGVLTTTPVVELQETPRRQLRQRLVEIPLPESSQQAEKSTSGSPQLETQKRDCIGHWLKKVNYGEGLPWKGRKVDRKSEGKQDADIKCNGNEENSVIQHVEAPRAELEKVQKLQKPAVRKSLRIASRRSMLEKNSSTVSVKLNCLGDNGIKSGKHVDANCEPAVIKQSEMQTPRLNRRDEEFETKEIKQENVEMDRKEDIVLGESACVTAGSSVPEQGSLSVKGMCRSLTQSGSISEDVVGAEPKPNLADKEVQTELWKLFVGTEKELKTEDTELEERTFVQDTSPKKRGVAVKKTPPLKQGRWNLRRRTVKLGSAKREEKAEGMDTERSEETLPEAESHEDKTDVQCSESLPPGTENAVESEPDIKEEDNAEPLKVSEKRTSAKKMKKKQEIEKAGVEEADKKIKRVNDQTKAIAAKLDQKAEEQNMEKSEETAKSALQLIVSNLDSSKTFGELQIAVINFFMERKLSVTAISIKKSRKRGHVTFLSGKDLNRAVRCDRELLLGRALRLRRPEQIQKPAAAVSGKKRKLTESAWDSTIPPPAKKKNVWKTPVLTEKNEKEPVSLPKKKKKRKQEQTVLGEETEEEKEATASPLQKKKKKHQGKVILSEKREEDAEEFTAPSIQQKKKKQEKMVLSEKGEDEGEDTAPMLQKKKEKNQEKSVLSEKREEEEEDTAPPPQKKKKKNLEKIVLSEKRDEEGEAKASVLQKKKKKNKEKRVLSVKREEKEHSASPKRKKKKKKKQEIISWYLYVQKMRPQERESELKATIGDFLNERSVAYKEIVLYPSSCSACVELYSEEDLNKALEFDVSKILGQAVRLSKVEKLGALVDEGDPRTLYVKSLPSEVCVKDLKNLFEKVAGVWIQDRQKISKRFAYVAFETAEAAENALRKSEIECKGKLIQLKHARQRSKGKRKILMVKNLSCPLSKKYLKSIFNDAEDVQVSKQKDNQSEGIAYIEFRTAKQAKVALKKFRDIGVPGQAIRIDSIEERKENPKSKSDSDVPIRSLFIWGLSSKTTVTTLKSTFKGAVTARLPTGKGKRFAFVDFETREEAVKTRAEMQDVEIDGRKVKIYFANCIKRQEEASEKPSCDLDTNGVPESSRTKPHEKRKKAKRKLSV